jgi:hypothetical protein
LEAVRLNYSIFVIAPLFALALQATSTFVSSAGAALPAQDLFLHFGAWSEAGSGTTRLMRFYLSRTGP